MLLSPGLRLPHIEGAVKTAAQSPEDLNAGLQLTRAVQL